MFNGRKLLGSDVTIHVPQEREVDTQEVLEMFNITYDTLYKRIQNNMFPEPVNRARHGDVAKYSIDEIVQWLDRMKWSWIWKKL